MVQIHPHDFQKTLFHLSWYGWEEHGCYPRPLGRAETFIAAKLNEFKQGKGDPTVTSDPRTNRIAAGDAKILLGDRKFKLLNDILEGFGGAFLEQGGGELWLV
jgi:hypothetical protein